MRGARKPKRDGGQLRKVRPGGEAERPTAPNWMRAPAKAEFERLVNELEERGLLSEACVPLIESAAILAERLQEGHRKKGVTLHGLAKELRVTLEVLGLASTQPAGAARRHDKPGRPPGGGDTRDDLIC